MIEVDYSDAALVAKLAARGLVPGAELSVVKNGDPLLVFVDETRWALSKIEAQKISVESLGTSRWSLKHIFKRLWR